MKTLLTRSILCAVLLATALSTEAQYRKLIHGERNPFDTAVAVEISRYRVEGMYFTRSKVLLDSLNNEARILTREVDSLYSEIRFKNLHIQNDSVRFVTLVTAYDTLSRNVNKLSIKFDQLAETKNKWGWKEWALAGLVVFLAGAAMF